jgi:hypothetical protein
LKNPRIITLSLVQTNNYKVDNPAGGIWKKPGSHQNQDLLPGSRLTDETIPR